MGGWVWVGGFVWVFVWVFVCVYLERGEGVELLLLRRLWVSRWVGGFVW